ncbi:MAG: hypothetical protein Q9166_004227 [cf. Caloplaca sp. 2 TL-2023]
MPKVLSYTPSWLSRPSPGFDLFASTINHNSPGSQNGASPQRKGSNKEEEYLSPRRTIAYRGTEVFVVVDNQIRWSDLSIIKYDWENSQRKGKKRAEAGPQEGQIYKVLQAPVSEQIRQLSISPNGQLLAIATSHTVHVAILPDSSKFEESTSTIKPQTHTLGPTTHVLSQSPVVSILWHPCGVQGTCLVTVTAEAAVRLWELNRANRWSFDSPTFAIDLKKLDAAQSQQDEVSPDQMNRNRGFSADAVGMEIASACFGGTGSPDESAWSAMTLWTATTDGDIYALCPLLPSKWQPTSTQLPSLSAVAVTMAAPSSPGRSILDEDMPINNDHYDWLSDIDTQVPVLAARNDDITMNDAVYSRPKQPGPIPRLQGPFQLAAGSLVDYLDVSDILVIASQLDTEELMLGEDDESEQGLQEASEGLSAAVVCLLTTDGRVHLFLDLEGIEGQWLPTKAPKHPPSTPEAHELVLFEALDTLDPEAVSESQWPTFSKDPFSRYSFFTTQSHSIYAFSLIPWIKRLEDELQNPSTAGATFRLNMLRDSPGTLRERILRFDQDRFAASNIDAAPTANACIVIYDSDLGYFLLTSTNNNTHPKAACLDMPRSFTFKQEPLFDDDEFDSPYAYLEEDNLGLTTHIARSTYEPPVAFWNPSSLLTLTSHSLPPHRRRTLRDEIRLSAATLDLMTSAHRLLSSETHVIRTAAADLFNRCERMMQDLRTQIERVREINSRAEQMALGGGGDEVEGKTASEKLGSRAHVCLERQEQLTDRIGKLRRKVTKLEAKGVSEKEREFFEEMQQLEKAVMKQDEDDDSFLVDAKRDGQAEGKLQPWWQRYDEVKELSEELVAKAKELGQEARGKKRREDEYGISNEMRKRKVEQVMGLLEREEALVDAVMIRLERLQGIGDEGIYGAAYAEDPGTNENDLTTASSSFSVIRDPRKNHRTYYISPREMSSENSTKSAATAGTSDHSDPSYYKTQYEQLEAELADFQASSRELEAELEKDIEAAEKRERLLQEKIESLGYEVEEWKTKYKQSKTEANNAQNSLQKEITSLRETNRTMQLKLRDIEVANDDFERQARHTTSSLEDLESKYNVSIERGVMFEEEIKVGENEREALRIETQRLRDELGDLRIEAEIRQDKLRRAEAAAEDYQRKRKASAIDPKAQRPQSAMSERSEPTTTSSPTVATPPTKSASSTVSETPTPPSPPTSDHSIPAVATPSLPIPKSRLSIADSSTTPRPQYSSRTPRYSRGSSGSLTSGRATPSIGRRTTLQTQVNDSKGHGLPKSGSLYQIRGLIGKMQNLEQRVHIARSKLPAPTVTPPRASPRDDSVAAQSHIPATITVRSNRKRTGGSNAASMGQSTPDQRPSSRLSFGYPQADPSRESSVNSNRPPSRASISSRASVSHLPSAASATSSSRPGSRQSMTGSRTPLGHYAMPTTQSESRRPRSSVGGSYATMHSNPGHSHGHSASVSRLSSYEQYFLDEEGDNTNDALTPTPARKTINALKDEASSSGIPSLSSKRYSGIGSGRRISSGLGEMGPPERRGTRKLSGVGEAF